MLIINNYSSQFCLPYLQLDGDPPLPLQVHVIQELLLHLPLLHRARELEQLIRQRRLAMVDVRDDAEVPDIRNGHLADQTVH